ncbi:dipeptidase [Pontivivens insulae]|uniref:Peptidase M19 n=1 Tax=Pontivivens insulae TaxID=1639689 RepID=A0A2R8AE48_9RHOB|nr:membrane dipeptidase [Pontivivens insulae]RED14250.1 microsomal dipeptidase-like Zn-dependent dipeptidase [Pontivivens insulae]SPF30325.1 hypothetical protein POI8812_02661 [Pontivivens insulae]
MLRKILYTLPVLLILGLAGFFIFAPGIAEQGQNRIEDAGPWPVSAEAQALHDRLLVADWHADSLLWDRDLSRRVQRGHLDLPRMIEGNVAVQVFTTVTKSPAQQNYENNSTDARDNITMLVVGQLRPVETWGSLLARGLDQAERLAETAHNHPELLTFVTSASELDAALSARGDGAQPVVGLLGTEGAHLLEGDIANLDVIEAAGFRVIGLTHFFDNELGGSLHGDRTLGLTEFGREVVAELDAREMIIDLAHASPVMAEEVLSLTDRPTIVSHTGIYSHCETVRNFPDELMQRIAAGGGLIGIGFWADVTCDASPGGIAGAILAGINVVGIDHVSLGSDFDGAVTTRFDASQMAAVTHALLEAGLSEEDIAKVMGGNMIRFLRENLPAN